MKPLCILAGTQQQYDRWLRKTGHTKSTAIHGYNADQINSAEYRKIETIGTFWRRPDSGQLYLLASERVR